MDIEDAIVDGTCRMVATWEVMIKAKLVDNCYRITLTKKLEIRSLCARSQRKDDIDSRNWRNVAKLFAFFVLRLIIIMFILLCSVHHHTSVHAVVSLCPTSASCSDR